MKKFTIVFIFEKGTRSIQSESPDPLKHAFDFAAAENHNPLNPLLFVIVNLMEK